MLATPAWCSESFVDSNTLNFLEKKAQICLMVFFLVVGNFFSFDACYFKLSGMTYGIVDILDISLIDVSLSGVVFQILL